MSHRIAGCPHKPWRTKGLQRWFFGHWSRRDLQASLKGVLPLEAGHKVQGADSPLLRDEYEAFLAWRQEQFWQEIMRVTGLAAPADLEATEDDEGPRL